MSKEMNEKELNAVTGGTSREKTMYIEIGIPNLLTDVTIMFYLDGELLSSKTTTVDCSVRNITIQLSGSGIKTLKVKFNDQTTKTYSINFDLRTYTETN